MPPSPIPYGGEYKDLTATAWLVEDKYDGIRAQAHVTPERVSLFSRTLNDVAASYPEVVAALRALPGSCALDGELVAVRDGRVLPFRYLQPRLGRVDPSPELQAAIPVRFVAFDAFAARERLDMVVVPYTATPPSIVARSRAYGSACRSASLRRSPPRK